MKKFSVTTVLGPFAGFGHINPDVLEHAARRGTRVHTGALCYALNLPCFILEEEDLGYFESFRNWFDDNVDEVLAVEKLMVDEELGFFGHVDLAAMVWGHVTVVDYKTPSVESPLWKAQLAAYRHLAVRSLKVDNEDCRCMSLLLRKDGSPAKGIPYQDSESDFAAFLSALNAYRYFKS